MKTIDVQAKEWFDKVNGNSYFSAQVTLDFGMDTEKTVYVPFQYGYGSYYITAVTHQLQTDNILPEGTTIYDLGRFCKENNVVLRYSKKEDCLKRDVKAWGSN